jgi:hypothetical protein
MADRTESEWFAATAKVVYELPNSAMGLAFKEVSLKSGAILRQWLLKASGGPELLNESASLLENRWCIQQGRGYVNLAALIRSTPDFLSRCSREAWIA